MGRGDAGHNWTCSQRHEIIDFLCVDIKEVCNLQQTPCTLLMIGCVSGWVLGGGGAALECGIRFHMLDVYNSVEGDRSFIIFDGDFLFAVGQISPQGAPNSQFWLCSRTCK
jgi:hypothetical protein